TICTPRRPKCILCPWCDACRARRDGLIDLLPARVPKRPRPVRHGMAFWVVRGDGAVLLRRRPASGLLGGMMEIPSTSWREAEWSLEEAKREAPLAARWHAVPGVVRHVFTHFELRLEVLAGEVRAGFNKGGVWVLPEDFAAQALPSVMRKLAKHVRQR
ncbi:MAG TPA: NUDIX domain-containing protein, partial [Stellaceae bacterium]|nr:NUDIX domain-containing protein [Stellaceae bacterium]